MFHRRNSSDAAIGWISTVDSLLLGFGLMLVLALHSAMTRGDQQAVADRTAKQLEAETEARERFEKENQEWQQKIEGLEMQSSRLREQLAAGVQGVEGINKKLEEALQERDALTKQQASDEQKVATALAELKDARKQRDEAKQLVVSEGKERTSLKARLDEMAERHESQLSEQNQQIANLRFELEKKSQDVSTLKATQSEADRLLKQALEDAAKHKAQADDVNRRMIAIEKSSAAIASREKAFEMAQRDLKQKLAEAESAVQRERKLQGELDARLMELVRVQQDLGKAESAKKALEGRMKKEASARGQAAATDVLGFKGRFRNVVFLIDISGSMVSAAEADQVAGTNGTSKFRRWDQTKREIVSWATHLPMESLRVVFFWDKVSESPGDGKSYSMLEGNRERSVRRLEGLLRDVSPKGLTNTPAAFGKAYSYQDVDTIVLFTDGAPNLPGSDAASLIGEVNRLVENHRDVPVNVVGIGEYYLDKMFAEFLLRIADTTGGEFIGR